MVSVYHADNTIMSYKIYLLKLPSIMPKFQYMQVLKNIAARLLPGMNNMGNASMAPHVLDQAVLVKMTHHILNAALSKQESLLQVITHQDMSPEP